MYLREPAQRDILGSSSLLHETLMTQTACPIENPDLPLVLSAPASREVGLRAQILGDETPCPGIGGPVSEHENEPCRGRQNSHLDIGLIGKMSSKEDPFQAVQRRAQNRLME